MDFLISELRTIDLLYIVDPNEKPNFTVDDSTREKHTFKVRDILINRLDQNYYSKIDQIKDPAEILGKIRDIKRYETNLTSMTIRKRLCNMEYDPNKEKAAEFWDRFEELVRNYDILPNVNPLSDDEKRDAFFNAISTAIPQIEFMDFMTSNSTGKSLTYDQLKAFILRHEANKIQTSKARPAALNVRKHDAKNRCYSCGGQGHRSDECRNDGKPQWYECGKIRHIAKDCFVRLARQKEQGATNKPSSSNNNNKQTPRRANNNKRSFGGKRKSNGAGNDNYGKRAKNSDKGKGGRQNKGKEKKGNQDDSKESQNGDKQAQKGNVETKNINITGCSAASVREQSLSDESNAVNNVTLTKFLADSGATEHLTNSRLIFKTFDQAKKIRIKCANKESQADLKSEGAGNVNIRLNDDEIMCLDNVICTEDLSENLLSLRKLADTGLSIYLDNRQIDIFDPVSHESFIRGIYQKPYWIIELEVDNSNNKSQRLKESNTTGTRALLTTEIFDNEHRYMTRSKTEIADKSKFNTDVKSSDDTTQRKMKKIKRVLSLMYL